MNTQEDYIIPKNLKVWFIIHFAVDISFALPLLFVPEWFLSLLGWETVDPITARMVAAALFGIGGESLLNINLKKDAFVTMLNLKIIWSIAAITGFVIALAKREFGYPATGFGLLAVFAAFNIVWVYWRTRLKGDKN